MMKRVLYQSTLCEQVLTLKLNFCDYVICVSEREDKDVKKKIQSRQYCLSELMDIKDE